MHLFDHVYLLLLVVVQPVSGALAFKRFVAAGAGTDRVRLYNRTLALEWVALAVLSGGWILLDRSAASLGFVAPGGTGFWGGTLLVLLLVILLIRSWRSARTMGQAERSKQVAALGKLVHFLPRTGRDLRHFAALSTTAGIVEEILYRGYVLWYLSLYLPLWGAVIASSAAFGIAHSYQGFAAALRTGVVGIAFAILYIMSGSIWLPIIAHSAIDILQGAMIFEILRRTR
jgi:membrane protease YdiL (CAAX protease family)